MILQMAKRRIGDVVIIDIKGAFSGAWAVKGREWLNHALASEPSQKLIFNFRQATSLDTLGVKSIFESVPLDKDLAILCGNSAVIDVMNRFSGNRRFRTFYNEREVLSEFGQDFVPEAPRKPMEQRGSFRLQTALPLEFYYEDGGEKVEFRAIVTNLSESGLFAEYIDLKSAEESLERLNPYDLKSLHLTLWLPKRKPIEMEGKVMHRKLDGEQVGIGIQFSLMDSNGQDEIRRFLKSTDFGHEMVSQPSEREES